MRSLRLPIVMASLAALSCTTSPEPPPVEFVFPELEIGIPDPPIEFRAPPSETWAPGAPGQPGLWRAEGPAGSFTLLGSVHMGDERTADLGARADAAIARSDEIVLELDLEALDPERTVALTERYGTLEPPTTLESLLSVETWSLLEDALARSDLPVESVQSMQPWLAAVMLSGGAWLAAGLDPEQGVEHRVAERARTPTGPASDGAVPIVGLETLESQLRMLASLPLPVQERMLRDALAPGESIAPSNLLDAWRRGDVDAFETLLEPADPLEELFYEHLIYQRNQQMAARLDAMAMDGKERFVVVGLLHLIGNRGIPALLAGRGYRVSRLH